MEKQRADYHLGIHARRLLLVVFPLIIFYLIMLVGILAPLEGGELIKKQELINTVFDSVGRGIIFMTGGAIILDYMEKKHKKEIEK
jgi:hypothetical protein